MTQVTQSPEGPLLVHHARVLRRQSSADDAFFLNDEEFRFAAACERMRVDRNGSVLSLLLVRLCDAGETDLAFFQRVLEGRLRVTDTPGLLEDGSIAVLLPDTKGEGAWKVATDISEVYPPGPGRPECEVLVYPHRRKKHAFEPTEEGAKSQEDSAATGSDTSSQQEGKGGAPSDEKFFAKAHPGWKRCVDLVGGSLGLVASLPIIVIAALAIKVSSPGPVFFRQRREGHAGRCFTMYKLRTMEVDAESKKQQLRRYSQQDGPAFKMERDPRTTLVGRFLRWTSMDELPQFWNVIKGEMSLVGPRPLPVEESNACQGWQRRRLHVVPGMTCTWQVCERGNVSFDEWVRMDLRYAEKRSLLEDLRLLLMTLPSVLFQRGMR